MKVLLSFVVCAICAVSLFVVNHNSVNGDTSASIRQLTEHNQRDLLLTSEVRGHARTVIPICGAILMLLIWAPKRKKVAASLLLFSMVGCRKPYEPMKLEMIEPNEVGFLISNTNVTEQSSTAAEDFAKNMVSSQQVKIPQIWIQTDYSTIFWNGEWRDAARLIKVDTASITREWTADPNSGTSNKNEAIWVMTSDQVEFSTGWTCTTKIASREDAALFLSNYRNGSLETVMDQEVRAKIQAVFGLAVTDLPMDTLRKGATPVIKQVTDEVTKFFDDRGITVTNIGITGGFVYKDPKIIAKMVEVFTAEQEKNVAIAKTVAQEETNKQILLEAKAKADALLAGKEAEAQGIQAVADAKAYEIEKAQENKEIYLELKRLEIDRARMEKWDGRYPVYFMGGEAPAMMMSMPAPQFEPQPVSIVQ
jgi:regulator of protease activity HflC (stomatin/prohibitin superfamily)